MKLQKETTAHEKTQQRGEAAVTSPSDGEHLGQADKTSKPNLSEKMETKLTDKTATGKSHHARNIAA